MHIQYLGFEQNLTSRTYGFRVLENLKPDREFQLSIDLRLVSANKFKLQDIPDLCFAKLKKDLGAETGALCVPLCSRVSETELKEYVANHYQGKRERS